MNILIVGFDSSISQTTRQSLESFIKSQSAWARLNDGAFVVVSQLSAVDLRNRITAEVRAPRLFVYTVNNRYWATANMPNDVTDWLQNNWSQS